MGNIRENKNLGPNAVTGDGAALSIHHLIQHITTGGAEGMTLADGRDGQEMFIIMISDGGDCILTPATPLGFATITFDADHESAHLLYTNDGWYAITTDATLG